MKSIVEDVDLDGEVYPDTTAALRGLESAANSEWGQGRAQSPARASVKRLMERMKQAAWYQKRRRAAAEEQHPGESAFRLVSDGPEGFAIRAQTARIAGRSIDVQTYIWHDDATGAFLAYRAIEAADRGVKGSPRTEVLANQHLDLFPACRTGPG